MLDGSKLVSSRTHKSLIGNDKTASKSPMLKDKQSKLKEIIQTVKPLTARDMPTKQEKITVH